MRTLVTTLALAGGLFACGAGQSMAVSPVQSTDDTAEASATTPGTAPASAAVLDGVEFESRGVSPELGVRRAELLTRCEDALIVLRQRIADRPSPAARATVVAASVLAGFRTTSVNAQGNLDPMVLASPTAAVNPMSDALNRDQRRLRAIDRGIRDVASAMDDRTLIDAITRLSPECVLR